MLLWINIGFSTPFFFFFSVEIINFYIPLIKKRFHRPFFSKNPLKGSLYILEVLNLTFSAGGSKWLTRWITLIHPEISSSFFSLSPLATHPWVMEAVLIKKRPPPIPYRSRPGSPQRSFLADCYSFSTPARLPSTSNQADAFLYRLRQSQEV